MRISDWSSDVCSSDLRVAGRSLLCPATAALPYQAAEPPELVRAIGCSCVASPVAQALVGAAQPVPVPEIEAEVAVIVTVRSEEHTSELQSLMCISYAVFCLKTKKRTQRG